MENSKPNYWQNAERTNGRMAMMGFFKMNLDIFLISFFAYLLVPVLMIAKGKKATN